MVGFLEQDLLLLGAAQDGGWPGLPAQEGLPHGLHAEPGAGVEGRAAEDGGGREAGGDQEADRGGAPGDGAAGRGDWRGREEEAQRGEGLMAVRGSDGRRGGPGGIPAG